MPITPAEIINIVSDLSGLVGAGFLALPFILRQEMRDAADMLSSSESAATEDTRIAVEAAHSTLRKEIAKYARKDLRYGKWGAGLLALSFILKIASVLVATFASNGLPH